MLIDSTSTSNSHTLTSQTKRKKTQKERTTVVKGMNRNRENEMENNQENKIKRIVVVIQVVHETHWNSIRLANFFSAFPSLYVWCVTRAHWARRPKCSKTSTGIEMCVWRFTFILRILFSITLRPLFSVCNQFTVCVDGSVRMLNVDFCLNVIIKRRNYWFHLPRASKTLLHYT